MGSFFCVLVLFRCMFVLRVNGLLKKKRKKRPLVATTRSHLSFFFLIKTFLAGVITDPAPHATDTDTTQETLRDTRSLISTSSSCILKLHILPSDLLCSTSVALCCATRGLGTKCHGRQINFYFQSCFSYGGRFILATDGIYLTVQISLSVRVCV